MSAMEIIPQYLMEEDGVARKIVKLLYELSQTCQSKRFLVSSKSVRFRLEDDNVTHRTIGLILNRLVRDGYLELYDNQGRFRPQRYYVDKERFLQKFGVLCSTGESI